MTKMEAIEFFENAKREAIRSVDNIQKIIDVLVDSISCFYPIEILEQEPSKDCIDRYSALAELYPLSYEYKAIKELPSVVPSRVEPKHRKWIDAREKDPCWFICSECKTMVDADYNYCPHCGARMEREE